MSNILIDIIKSDDFNKFKKILENNFIINESDFELFHIQEITYEDEAPRKEALENVISSMQIDSINFLYLIIGSKNKISFYFGIVKNRESSLNNLDIDDIANHILKANIEGNFRGSRVARVKRRNRKKILNKIKNYKYIAEINGVPNVNEEAKHFQGVDRLVDIMNGDEFALLIISKPLSLKEINSIEEDLFKIYDKISPFVKKTIQKSISKSRNNSETDSNTNSETDNSSNTNSESDTESKTSSITISTSKSKSVTESNSSKQKSDSSSENNSKSTNTTSNKITSASKSKSNSKIKSKTKSLSYIDQESDNETTTVEFERKEFEEWLKYIDDILLKRVNYAKGKGGFISGVYLFADTKGKITKLANSFISLFSGVEQNKVPLTYTYIENKDNQSLYRDYIYNFQLPKYRHKYKYGGLKENQRYKMLLYSKYNMLNWFSTRELSVIASLPQKEVIGLRLKEEVEFGLNIDEIDDNKINLGKMVKSGIETNIDVNLPYSELNKHIFIAGVTGSGKTTTCQRLLFEADIPFLVIEPAKTEYRNLMGVDDILVFTLGDENLAPFRLNPFEFFEGENISSRVDMIKATIESAFDMEAAIPQIIESAIYSAYQKFGWDIATGRNSQFENPFEKNINSFPTLEDVISEVNIVVERQGFDDRLKNDYIGSIKARLQGLTVGTKGSMLNTSRGFDFRELLDKRVVIELEEIKSPSEKSFIMGLILVNLNEAIKIKYKQNRNFRHITLIEEAHRLLSKYEFGDSPNKKRGVESFTDMLAEIRKYGESLIIVDQIPNKLTSEVLKNTNTKIVHRLFAIDDKEAIGNTMALTDEQKNFLSRLEVGRAVLFNQNYYNAIQVQISPLNSQSIEVEVSEDEIRDKWLSFYRDILELQNINLDNFSKIFEFSRAWQIFLDYERRDEELFNRSKGNIHDYLNGSDMNIDELSLFLNKVFYNNLNSDLKGILIELKKSKDIGFLIKKIRRR